MQILRIIRVAFRFIKPTTGWTLGDYASRSNTDQEDDAEEEEEEMEHDVKPSARMLPLHLIRPTIRQNLARSTRADAGSTFGIWAVWTK